MFFFPHPSPSRSGEKKIEYQLDLSRLICVARLFLPGLYETQIARLSGLFIRPAYLKKYVPWRWYLLRLSNARYGRQTGYFVQHFQARVRGEKTPGKKASARRTEKFNGLLGNQPNPQRLSACLPCQQASKRQWFSLNTATVPLLSNTDARTEIRERERGMKGRREGRCSCCWWSLFPPCLIRKLHFPFCVPFSFCFFLLFVHKADGVLETRRWRFGNFFLSVFFSLFLPRVFVSRHTTHTEIRERLHTGYRLPRKTVHCNTYTLIQSLYL